jgi:error-prone DNA polymerase
MKIIKVDLLGLGMMAALKDCLDLVPAHYHQPLDLAQLPQNDPPTYRALQTADTVGMFQVESRAQMAALPRNHPTGFYDLVVQVAIIRPGPIVGNMMNPYMKRRSGREPVTYYHPLLEPVLKRTLGIPLFQEQLIRMAMIVANFTGGEAEELRRAVGMRRSMARMKELESKLRRGMSANGLAPKAQDEIVQAISSFALYGFPESHAASFALIAYASAYLKCHYLAAFTAALLNNQPMGFYSPATLIKDAQRHGLRVLPVDVQHSDWPCTLEPEPMCSEGAPHLPSFGGCGNGAVEKNVRIECTLANVAKNGTPRLALRLGLCYARGLRREAAGALLAARGQQPFTAIQDLALRVPELRKNELALLAKIGALNSLGGSEEKPVAHRRDALWQVAYAGRPAGPLLDGLAQDGLAQDELAPNEWAQDELSFHEIVPDAGKTAQSSPLRQMTIEERLVADFSGTGVTIGKHPMAFHRAQLKRMGVFAACELARLPHGRRARIAGCVIARQRPGTAKGFVFLSIEDETGIANAIVTPAVYEQFKQVVVYEKFLLIEGELQNQENVISVKARTIRPLNISQAEVRSHDFH